MSGLEPFEPDELYCVHCHAPAAGMCAECGALCCADCVELRLGWTRQRAVCRACLARSEASPQPHLRRSFARGWMVAALLAAAAIVWLLL